MRADKVQQRLPWLYKLYRNDFLELAAQAWREPVKAAVDDRYGIVLNVQRGKTMRFECHVDSNPLTGLLFLTDHPAGGGELVVSHDPDAVGRRGAGAELLAHPAACGAARSSLTARHYPHYARDPDGRARRARRRGHELLHRIMPGIDPPAGLNRHLFGHDYADGRRVTSEPVAV